jgi:hypothetical protein
MFEYFYLHIQKGHRCPREKKKGRTSLVITFAVTTAVTTTVTTSTTTTSEVRQPVSYKKKK